MHPFTHVRLTPKGIDLICEYVDEVRAVVGDEVPIAADHFGHIGIDDCIRLGQALEPYNLAWLEDLVPWQFTDKWVQLERALNTPVCTGEDIYLKEGFLPLLEARAVNIIHPDLATSGGIMETKKIGDLAQEYGDQHGAAHGRHADQHDGERPLRRRDRELHRPGAPFQRDPLLERLHRRRAEADHPERLHPRARRRRASASRSTWTRSRSTSSPGIAASSSRRRSGTTSGAATTGSGHEPGRSRAPTRTREIGWMGRGRRRRRKGLGARIVPDRRDTRLAGCPPRP